MNVQGKIKLIYLDNVKMVEYVLMVIVNVH